MQDIAIVMLVAGVVTVLFHRLRQPVVLGYILAGLIIGPHTPPFPLIRDEHTIDIMAELGVIMLMFGLGLHFSLKDLARVGATAFVAASLEILVMVTVGYGLGQMFGWSKIDSIFLGAILSISSTTIIIKALQELGLTGEKFAHLIFGILIVEDILAIAMLALLSGIATTGDLGLGDVLMTLSALTVFLTAVIVLGLLAVPRMLEFVDRFKSSEVLLIASLGICFGISLLADKMGYSVALGAFLAGAVIAEGRQHAKIELLVQPVRDMFSAVFFVAIGMMIEPKLLVEYAVPILVITIAVVVGKVATCSIGAFVTGHPPKTSLRVGMGIAQIGEFSFIIASLGLTLGVISNFLYPITVTVSAVTTLLTPYLIRNSDRVAGWMETHAPRGVANYMGSYGGWFRRQGDGHGRLPEGVRQMLLRWGTMTALNFLLVTGLFVAAPLIANAAETRFTFSLPAWTGGVRGLVWLVASVAALPFLVVTIQKLRAGSMLLAELWTAPSPGAAQPAGTNYGQAVIGKTLFIIGAAVVGLWLVLLSIAVLPPWPVALAFVILLCLLTAWRWKTFARLYARGQAALVETLAENGEPLEGDGPGAARPLPSALLNAEIQSVIVSAASPAAGKRLREVELRTRTGASAVAIEREGQSTVINPGPDEEILPGDRIMLLGSREQIRAGHDLLGERGEDNPPDQH